MSCRPCCPSKAWPVAAPGVGRDCEDSCCDSDGDGGATRPCSCHQLEGGDISMLEGGDIRRMPGVDASSGPACGESGGSGGGGGGGGGGRDGGCGGCDVGGENGNGTRCSDDEGVAASAKRASPSHQTRRCHARAHRRNAARRRQRRRADAKRARTRNCSTKPNLASAASPSPPRSDWVQAT